MLIAEEEERLKQEEQRKIEENLEAVRKKEEELEIENQILLHHEIDDNVSMEDHKELQKGNFSNSKK